MHQLSCDIFLCRILVCGARYISDFDLDFDVCAPVPDVERLESGVRLKFLKRKQKIYSSYFFNFTLFLSITLSADMHTVQLQRTCGCK